MCYINYIVVPLRFTCVSNTRAWIYTLEMAVATRFGCDWIGADGLASHDLVEFALGMRMLSELLSGSFYLGERAPTKQTRMRNANKIRTVETLIYKCF